ncbi:single-stranded-DNA-specific exonuclease C-terminal domain-containing protein [Paenibacillus sp. CC-CFT747]|nr:single-stranded-DNA-specific exonuclease C-terminal domain-containing protein [Paenibacillus sp. CC-CFT747]
MVLYSLPRSIGQLEAVLGSLGGVERIYAVFREYPSADQSILPTRDMFKQVYAVVRQENTYRGSREDPLNYFSKRSGLSRPLVKFIMEVFEELSLVEYTGTDYRCVPAPAKKEFTQSERFRQRQRLQEVEQQLIYSSAAELTRLLLQSVPKTH